MRVAILTEIISPYRIPVFNHLATDPNIDLKVIFASESEGRRHWRVAKEQIRFDYEVLPVYIIGRTYQNASVFFNPTIVQRLHQGNYDTIILGGYHHLSYWLAIAYGKIAHKNMILWSESTLLDFRNKGILRHDFKTILIKSFNRYLVPGIPQRDYLLSFEVPANAIWTAPNAVDVDYFSNASSQAKKQKDAIKDSWGIKGDVILFVGRLIDEKGVMDLLQAFERVAQKRSVTLVIVGSGQQEQQYRKYAETHKLRVVFTGFVQQEDLPSYYAVADIFVFPTHTDPWGLVLNEAMSCNLPLISSTAAGATTDLVKHGWNGYVFAPGDINALTNCLDDLLASPQLRETMGKRSREMIESYRPEDCARGFVDVIFSSKPVTSHE